MQKQGPKPEKPERRRSKNPVASYARYSALAMQAGVLIAGGAFGGLRIDRWLNFVFPVFTILLSLLAVAAAIWLLVRESNNKSTER